MTVIRIEPSLATTSSIDQDVGRWLEKSGTWIMAPANRLAV